eukprot:CAMPEP_0194438214 /NCGR_PEP_ID=MMETSP0176-20130528/103805_1 /TAXON_ID=216777 /ORGANISM="Proboscia alata, Strain PI-D3" /LENGTH=64 /DNA_ID=CAMNT_0039260193 /DNA_START=17 /DNA_END=207 /DNA_ORIENTATION=+
MKLQCWLVRSCTYDSRKIKSRPTMSLRQESLVPVRFASLLRYLMSAVANRSTAAQAWVVTFNAT